MLHWQKSAVLHFLSGRPSKIKDKLNFFLTVMKQNDCQKMLARIFWDTASLSFTLTKN